MFLGYFPESGMLSHLLPVHSLIIPSRSQSVQPQYIVFSDRFTSARIAPWHPRLLHLISISVISSSCCEVLWSMIMARKLAILRPEMFIPAAMLPFSSRRCVMFVMYMFVCLLEISVIQTLGLIIISPRKSYHSCLSLRLASCCLFLTDLVVVSFIFRCNYLNWL